MTNDSDNQKNVELLDLTISQSDNHSTNNVQFSVYMHVNVCKFNFTCTFHLLQRGQEVPRAHTGVE